MNSAGAARIQAYRAKATECFGLKNSAATQYAKDVHDAAAQEWMQLADLAQRVETAYPDRPMQAPES
jgi:hypothetical protein